MRYLKLFEVAGPDTFFSDIDIREPKDILCVDTLHNNDFHVKFTVGNFYSVETWFANNDNLQIRANNNSSYILDKKDEHTWVSLSTQTRRELATFTDDKSMEAYKKRLVTQQFDL